MTTEPKTFLRTYLQAQRDALIWKLDGLSEKQARWPLTPTGTNLLGLVKHVASMEAGYLGDVFGRPFPEELPWFAEDVDLEANGDLWATAEETIPWVADFYRRTWAHSDATIEALELTAEGRVPWWNPARQQVTLEEILVHVIQETARHAGHADIVRELTDGHAGLRADNTNLPEHTAQWWADYVERLKAIATASAG